MSLLNRFLEVVKARQLFSVRDRLLLAVSGGVDSVVLCELCRQGGFTFEMAHCNFRLRGEESDRDEHFVRSLGEKYQVPVHVRRFDTAPYAQEKKISVQEAARALRYEWFSRCVEEMKAKFCRPDSEQFMPGIHVYLVTAHHADDSIETVFMNLFRGTGLHGLTGIPEKNDFIRRPLLCFFKQELADFAREQQLMFVEDSSNASPEYTRNYLRNDWIPAVQQIYPRVKENLYRNIERFRETERLYKLAVGEIKKKLMKKKGEEWHIPVKQLMQFNNRALIYEIISEFGFTEKQIDEVVKLAEALSGKYIDAPDGKYRIVKHRHWLIMHATREAQASLFVIEENTDSVIFPGGRLSLRKKNENNPSPLPGQNKVRVDAGEIQFPLILRRWKAGDYFYPLGMKKKKKIARFLIDLKLSKPEKENVWVLESQKKIIWVLGYRIDERFKITERTEDYLELTLES
ncbi:MAG: tRNA lysidine(34) synthetase TilS [Chitinophagaceae bacterium]|nr:tRNA lysidine(34) synthetase TilS [Chitinophagaceae bacterium]